MDILNNDFITYDCIRTSVEITPEEQVAFAVEKGDMLFQRSSETLEDVGRANVYMDDRPAVFGGFVIRGKKKAEYNPMFFRYLLASPYARKKVIPMGAGAQHFNIGQDGLSKVKLHFPILQEQQKIADLLRLINERISTQNKIIEDLKKLKSAISKHLFARKDLLEYTSNPQPIGFSGILLAKRQNSFYCTYFLHNRNVADTKSPYPIKRLEVIRWFNQKSMVFNQSLS